MLRRAPINLIRAVSVWGGGTMGSGIAQVVAQSGTPVTVVDTSDKRLDLSRKSISESLSRVAKKKHEGDKAKAEAFLKEVLARINFTKDPAKAAAEADLIVEAVVENLEVKRELFATLDKLAPKNVVFCSNTSSLRVGSMAGATSRADRFAGLHFFSPVPMMKLVEVVRTDAVSEAVVQDLLAFTRRIGKTPVLTKDTDGFIVNRLLIPYQLEACRLVERGVASVQDVDTAMKLGCGHPMGPFELCDSVGIDVLKFVVDGWHKAYPTDPAFAPSKLIDSHVAAGTLGKKTGQGFYKYDSSGRKLV